MSDAGPFRLDGKVAIVTGAAGGIGRATARSFADAGATVLCSDLPSDALDASAAACGGSAHPADVGDEAAVDALIAAAVDAHGRLDVLANVAGILATAPIVALERAELDRIFDVNLRGTFHGCRAAARVMREQRSGSIVNVASSAAFQPTETLGAYTMSKSAVVALTRVLALEVARRGVRVNAVAPGMIDTPMAGRRFRAPDGSQTPEQREAQLIEIRERNPLGIEGHPEDAANTILFLASDASRYMTGQVLHPNGGSPIV